MAEVGLSDVMEHLAIAFGGIYEKLTERDREVETLRRDVVELAKTCAALSNRIEGVHRNLSERIERKTFDTMTEEDARKPFRLTMSEE